MRRQDPETGKTFVQRGHSKGSQAAYDNTIKAIKMGHEAYEKQIAKFEQKQK